jgi:hypothetical protein
MPRFASKVVLALAASNFLPPANAAPLSAALVPGATNSHVTQANIHKTICVSGWTKTVRPPASYTTKLKREQMAQFHLAGDAHDYEEDHLISLEVGGNPTSPENLWPQPWAGPRNARKKDRLENLERKLVCSGQISLRQGRRELSLDWVAAYRNRIGAMP